jgi:acyl carrier protein
MPSHVTEDLADFLVEQLRVRRDRLSTTTRLAEDLGVDGEDGVQLIAAFGKRFDVDLGDFHESSYFGPEAAANPFVWAWWLITRTWPKTQPITVADLEASAVAGRWLLGTTASATTSGRRPWSE